jgi:hypothetical protein
MASLAARYVAPRSRASPDAMPWAIPASFLRSAAVRYTVRAGFSAALEWGAAYGDRYPWRCCRVQAPRAAGLYVLSLTGHHARCAAAVRAAYNLYGTAAREDL